MATSSLVHDDFAKNSQFGKLILVGKSFSRSQIHNHDEALTRIDYHWDTRSREYEYTAEFGLPLLFNLFSLSFLQIDIELAYVGMNWLV